MDSSELQSLKDLLKGPYSRKTKIILISSMAIIVFSVVGIGLTLSGTQSDRQNSIVDYAEVNDSSDLGEYATEIQQISPVNGTEDVQLRSIYSRSANYIIPAVEQYYDAKSIDFEKAVNTPDSLVRVVSSVSLAHASGLRGGYDASVDVDKARDQASTIIRLSAQSHKANGGQWGLSWQSQIPASQTGLAGWLMWDDVDNETRNHLKRMIIAEANYTMSLPNDYYRNSENTIVRAGNSGSEEEAWRSRVLSLAYAMMPRHENADKWQSAFAQRHISAFATPADATGDTTINGHKVCTWVDGSNIEPNGDIVNHQRIHPTYMRTPHSVSAIVQQRLAGQDVTSAHTHNLNTVFSALIARYNTDGTIVYPGGNDWGRSQLPLFYAHNLTMDSLGMKDADMWASLHQDLVAKRQSELTTGQLYRPGDFRSDYPDAVEFDAAAKLGETWLLLTTPETSVTDTSLPQYTPYSCPEKATVASVPSSPQNETTNQESDSNVANESFTDINRSEVKEAATWASKNGHISKITDTTFQPGVEVSRLDLVRALWSVEGKPNMGTNHPFLDIPKNNSDHAKAVTWAYKTQVTLGKTKTTFDSNSFANRAQAIVMLWRSQGEPYSGSRIPFNDVSDTIAPAVRWAYSEDVTSGTTKTTFSPDDPVTRGQLAVMLYRLHTQ